MVQFGHEVICSALFAPYPAITPPNTVPDAKRWNRFYRPLRDNYHCIFDAGIILRL